MSDRADIAVRRVVYEMPGQDDIQVVRERYTASGGGTLPLDLYLPPAASHRPAPAVILVTGYDDRGMRRALGCAARELAAFECWGRLLAASGMVGVSYECHAPVADAHAVMDTLRQRGDDWGIDAARLGLWSCSGHAANALGLLMDDHDVDAAALCYPYLLDLDGSTWVTDAARTFRFVTPADGRPVSDLPGRTRTLVVRAGLDESPGLNPALDRFVAHALAANRPVSLLNHADGPHAFDLVQPDEASRRAVRTVLWSLQTSLGALLRGCARPRLYPAHSSGWSRRCCCPGRWSSCPGAPACQPRVRCANRTGRPDEASQSLDRGGCRRRARARRRRRDRWRCR
ncbi:MAG: alpha/beta hydrolase [Vicinamibacterales bacterium]